MKLFNLIFSINDYKQTHHLVKIFGLKITFQKRKYSKLRLANPYYYYKKNNIDITSLPPATGQTRDIQLANLALLDEMDFVCRQAGLTYWLDGGTLLGAVRHKGFIPWDDDIDTAMLREDFEKIIDAFKKYSRNPDIFADYSKNPKYPAMCIIKVQHKKCPHLFVDIFPWDYYGKRISIEEQLEKTLYLKSLRKELADTCTNKMSKAEILQKIASYMKNKVLFNKETEENGDYVWGLEFNHPWKNWFTRYEVLHPLKTIEFEGKQYPCLNYPDAFLSRGQGRDAGRTRIAPLTFSALEPYGMVPVQTQTQQAVRPGKSLQKTLTKWRYPYILPNVRPYADGQNGRDIRGIRCMERNHGQSRPYRPLPEGDALGVSFLLEQ